MAAINHLGEEETDDSGHYFCCDLKSSFKSRPSESSRWWTPEFERKVDNMLRSVVDWSDGVSHHPTGERKLFSPSITTENPIFHRHQDIFES
ncbi:hypothetical protein L1987_49928 [Smallanthus sonchifolius]|uniref:Uncharacterized protein n=1 Tax=Smallanthus sonchifolius TaxID=185202 RepID=A0ACB9FX26_9ASTR|nr:hypothetical protein L1987_49928 [Smallanthus sonchifolius]